MMRIPSLAAALLVLAAGPALAQTVRGTFVAGTPPEGVPAARVVLVSEAGEDVAGAETDRAGAFVIQAPRPGTFRLRAERIGFSSTVTAPFTLSAGQTVQRRLEASTERVGLEGITVAAGNRCVVRPQRGMETAVVWEEARKALESASSVSRRALYSFDARRYRRDLEPVTRMVTSEVTSRTPLRGNPFATARADVLAEEGWVMRAGDTLVYHAPDASVLLSDQFLNQHCFRLAPPDPDREGQIGLSFEPVRGRRVPDQAGTLWLDRESSELRTLDFRYTGLRLGEFEDVARGRLDFRRLPNGTWIVTRWHIQMPVMALQFNASGWEIASETRREALLGVKVDGGEVLAIRDAAGRPVALEPGAVLAGTVTDSTRGAPMPGARVYLANTTYSATTDEGGRYVMRDLPEGRYAVTFEAPRLDTLRWAASPVPVALTRGATARQDLAVPAMPGVLTALCADSAGGGARLAGYIRADSAGGEPLAGVKVTANWETPDGRKGAVETRTDYRGIYRLCSVPPGATLALEAEAPGSAGSASGVRVAAGRPLQQDLEIPRPTATLAAAAAPREPRPGPGGGGGGSNLFGRVLSADGTPLAGAMVRLREGKEERTDPQGRFTFEEVGAGSYNVSVSHPQRGQSTVRVSVPERQDLDLTLRLRPAAAPTEAVALAPLVATARPTTRAEIAQRSVGTRHNIIPREVIQRYAGGRNVQNVLRGQIPGLTVIEVYYPNSLMVWYMVISYQDRPVEVYLDGTIANMEEVARLSPSNVESIEFFPNHMSAPGGYLNYKNGLAVLLIHTVGARTGRR